MGDFGFKVITSSDPADKKLPSERADGKSCCSIFEKVSAALLKHEAKASEAPKHLAILICDGCQMSLFADKNAGDAQAAYETFVAVTNAVKR